jgi:uncharacterized protein
MPEYLSPDVYIEEQPGPNSIEGVSTSTAGFVGMARRGPTKGRAVLVTSYPEFVRRFGDYFDFGPSFLGYNHLPYAVDGFFTNGGQRLYVLRVKPSDAVAGTVTAVGGASTRLLAGSDAGVGLTKLRLASLRGLLDGSKIRLQMVRDGITWQTSDLTIAANGIDRSTQEVTVAPAIDINALPNKPATYSAALTTVLTNVTTLDAAGVPLTTGGVNDPGAGSIKFSAADAGSWADDLVVQLSTQSVARGDFDTLVSGAAGNNVVALKSAKGFYKGAWVEIDTVTGKRYRLVKAVAGNNLVLDGAALAAADFTVPAGKTVLITSCEFGLTASYGGLIERFDGMTLEKVPGRYYVDVLSNSQLVVADPAVVPGNTSPLAFPRPADGIRLLLPGGNDGSAPPTTADFRGSGTNPADATGLKALELVDQISIIAAPGVTGQAVQEALINQCERLKDRFAVLDPAPAAANGAPTLDNIQSQRGLFDTHYAALYYPRLIVEEPASGMPIAMSPSGHVMGIYARTDEERGVHKAPANETLRGILGLESTLNREAQDILNPLGINVLRDFRSDQRGFRVWGARCITSDTAWKYVPVRRLFIFIEESLQEGTQWVVFEPNDEPLWAKVRQVVGDFLRRVWRDGALAGATPEQAFFVKCDHTTMTQDDIDNGRLIMIVGIAPVKPAEFVIIRIGQWTAGANADAA